MARIPVAPRTAALVAGSGRLEWLHRLHLLPDAAATRKLSRRELVDLLTSLATLVENGLPLRRALATLASERSLKKHAPMLHTIRRKIEAGESFSAALGAFPSSFSELLVNQVRVGERSGTLPATLWRITAQVQQASDLQSQILKRLSYPLVVATAGMGVVAFLLMHVVPQFEATYRKAKIPLPLITRVLMAIGDLAVSYGWVLLLAAAVAVVAVPRWRRNPVFAYHSDRLLLRLPVLGDWLRDMAVMRLMDVLSTMMQSGFKLVDALAIAAGSMNNQMVRQAVEDLRSAVIRGERLSRELERHEELFPPIVSQLVIVGEQTGNLAKSAQDVSVHLRRQIERKADLLVGSLEPALTIAMAVAIGVILLAIYLPMFNMVDAVDATGGR